MTAVYNAQPDQKYLGPHQYQNNGWGDRQSSDYGSMTPTTNGSVASLPGYNYVTGSKMAGASGFEPNRLLHIQNEGYCGTGFEGQRPDPVFVYEVTPNGQNGSQQYVSLRFKRSSGNCILIRAGDTTETPLASTTYRIAHHPRISMQGIPEEIKVQGNHWNCFSRKTTMVTPLGEFRWRYGSRKERHAIGARSLIILEQYSGASEKGRPVAQLVRNKELRSEGSSFWSSGNGGRLMLDLRPWANNKGLAQQIETLAVSSCLVMLKKEVDDTRAAQVNGYTAASSAGAAAAASG